jgi:hypothetical protein
LKIVLSPKQGKPVIHFQARITVWNDQIAISADRQHQQITWQTQRVQSLSSQEWVA